ncbi:MAG: sodium:solute symporter family protein [Bacteroidota bacterium]
MYHQPTHFLMPSYTHPLDIAIFVIFLFVTLAVGLGYGRQTKTIQDYALGGKNFATPILTATIVATWTSGWVLALILEKVYTEGLYFIIAITGDALALLFIGRFLASRVGEFLNNVSVAETMGKLYGKRVRIITAIAGISKAIGIVAVQFKVSAKVMGLLFGLQGTQAAFLAAAIVILYSTFGGIRAVTFTDAFQFITFGIFIPILALVVWNSVKDSISFMDLLITDPSFSFTALIRTPTRWGACLSLMLFFTVSGMGPALFQRISMARNVKQAKQAFTNAFILYMGIILFMVWLAVLVRASSPNVEPSLLLNYVINRYAYVGLKGGVTVGIMAMVMSTADSYINTASVLFTHDIIGVLRIKFTRPIIVARAFAFSLGVLGLCLALVMDDLLEIALLVASLYIPMITAPLLLALFGFRTSKRVLSY